MSRSPVFSTPRGSEREEENGKPQMGYQQTLMYGRYSKSLGRYAKEEAKKAQMVERKRKRELDKRHRELTGNSNHGTCYHTISRWVTMAWKQTFAKIGEDWVFLAVLGVIMACVSFVMDVGISLCGRSRLWFYKYASANVIAQYLAWVTLPVFLVLFSAGFVNIVAPQASGSGIPEMKTILRGVVLPEYLAPKTLLAKVVGLTCTLGSGMPLGKEGPFVHIASIMATSLSKLVTSFQGIYANESRQSEMLAAACAVGVACCFGSPIGGVLFSIEVTSVYFAVRNYWRGFFAAVCGAMTFRLLAIWFQHSDTIVVLFPTSFRMDFPYDPQELFVFALIGIFCGLGGSLYVYLHRRYVLWMRGNKKLSKFLQKNRFIYPFFVSWLITTLSFPPWIGQFQASEIGTHEQVEILFSNYTWTREPEEMSVEEWAHVKHWVTPYTSIFFNLFIYSILTFFLSIIAATLQVPTGVLIPSFKVGAAFGRMVGEGMHVWFPDGLRYGDVVSHIMPGGYATVGAAAFTGAVTHTISISVIVFEMTGQITHCVPVLIAVLIANAIASLLQPSCYDSIIMIKKLPYLPDILPASSGAYNIYVDDFMIRQIKYIWNGMTYNELRDVLRLDKSLKGFPLVDNPNHMILLGSIQRTELVSSIEKQIGRERRLKVANQRYDDAIQKERDEELRKREEEQQQLQQKLEIEERRIKEEQKRKKEEEEKSKLKVKPKMQRKPSRFEVTTEDGAIFIPVSNEAHVPPNIAEDNPISSSREYIGTNLDPNSPAMKALQQLSSKPKKSILKKNNSYTIHSFGVPGLSPPESFQEEYRPKEYHNRNSPYQTVTGAENKIKDALSTLGNLFKRPSQMNLSGGSRGDGLNNVDYDMDMSLEEQREWEAEEMEKVVNFKNLQIDPAPFQLVEKTSLLKVHSLFSMLGVNLAYVTAIGQLIGVVGLKELRNAIEGANSGQGNAKKVEPAQPVSATPEVDPSPGAFSRDSRYPDSEDDLMERGHQRWRR